MAHARKGEVLQVKLNISELGAEERVKLASVIGEAAPGSALYGADAAVKSAADAVIQSGAALDAVVKERDALDHKAMAARSAIALAEVQFDKDLVVFKTMAEVKCKNEKELNDLGLNRRAPKASPGPLVAPEGVIAKPGKEAGSMMVTVKRTGSVATYAAEISADPIGPETWQPIPGTGARRKLTGRTSGALYWVRFRALSAADQGPWSQPVSVTAR